MLSFWCFEVSTKTLYIEAEHCLPTVNFTILIVVDVTGCVSDMVTHTHTWANIHTHKVLLFMLGKFCVLCTRVSCCTSLHHCIIIALYHCKKLILANTKFIELLNLFGLLNTKLNTILAHLCQYKPYSLYGCGCIWMFREHEIAWALYLNTVTVLHSIISYTL